MSGNNYRIAVVDRTFDLLEALESARGPLGVSDLAREIGATKSAVFRILANLERRGYVVRDPLSSKYQLGGRLAQLGHQALKSIDIRSRARPVLEDLHQQFNETVNLGMLVESTISYVDMIESDQGLRMSAQVGATDEMHSTALGKAILSFLPETERDRILSRPLVRRTSRTMTDPDILRAELARIRSDGVAEDQGENEDGAHCFGAPIFDYQGNVIAAVSVSSPDSRLYGERLTMVVDAVRAAAIEITANIGGRWPVTVEGEEDQDAAGSRGDLARNPHVLQ